MNEEGNRILSHKGHEGKKWGNGHMYQAPLRDEHTEKRRAPTGSGDTGLVATWQQQIQWNGNFRNQAKGALDNSFERFQQEKEQRNGKQERRFGIKGEIGTY